MLTKEESLRFITNLLGIREPDIQMKTNTWEFLNNLISSIHSIPFQCITLVEKPLQERRRPSPEEVKSSMLEGKGGLCYTFNLFTYHLLNSLGFDVYLNSCQCPHRGSIYNNHLLVLVYNLRQGGDIHLVDTGCASPTFMAINLDFKEESPLFHESFLRFKFVRSGNKIQRMHDRSGFELSPGRSAAAGEFELFYEFEINPIRSLETINPYFDCIYTDPDLSVFHRSVRAIKFVNKKVVVLCNSRLAVESVPGDFKITTFQTDDELRRAYQTYFPELDASAVRQAIYIWRNEKI